MFSDPLSLSFPNITGSCFGLDQHSIFTLLWIYKHYSQPSHKYIMIVFLFLLNFSLSVKSHFGLFVCFVFYVFVTYLVQTLPTLSVASHLSQMLKLLRCFIHLIFFFFFLNIYLFTWLCQVWQHMGSSVFIAACKIFSCGMQTLPAACGI